MVGEQLQRHNAGDGHQRRRAGWQAEQGGARGGQFPAGAVGQSPHRRAEGAGGAGQVADPSPVVARRRNQRQQAVGIQGAEGAVQQLFNLKALAVGAAGFLDFKGDFVGVGAVGAPAGGDETPFAGMGGDDIPDFVLGGQDAGNLAGQGVQPVVARLRPAGNGAVEHRQDSEGGGVADGERRRTLRRHGADAGVGGQDARAGVG